MVPMRPTGSPLASKTTGYPIEKLAAKLAIGYTLAELANDITSIRRDGKVERTRPLCPFPQIAYYKGSGSIDEARNFECRNP